MGFAISPLGAIGIVYANYGTRDVYCGAVPATGSVEFEEVRSSPDPSYGHYLVYDSMGRPNVAYSDFSEMHIIDWHE